MNVNREKPKLRLKLGGGSSGPQEKRRATAMLTALAERWPRCFDLERPRPLKIAIHKDIIAEMRRAETDLAFATDLRLAMRLYTGSPAYLQALVEGAVRIDLNGVPSGLVKAPHAGFAKYRFCLLYTSPSPRD